MNNRQSWECHKCNAVNAPHVDQCSCSAASLTPVMMPFVQTPYVMPTWPITSPGTFTIPRTTDPYGVTWCSAASVNQ